MQRYYFFSKIRVFPSYLFFFKQNTLLLLVSLILSAAAQDFKLFYAKNVTDVTQFRNLTELDKQLSWRQVTNGAIDGNDKEDLFHVNWGWSGLADEAADNGGFYRLNSMKPTNQGITLRYKMTKGVIDNIMLMPLACRFRTPPAQYIARPPRPPDTESYQGSLHP